MRKKLEDYSNAYYDLFSNTVYIVIPFAGVKPDGVKIKAKRKKISINIIRQSVISILKKLTPNEGIEIKNSGTDIAFDDGKLELQTEFDVPFEKYFVKKNVENGFITIIISDNIKNLQDEELKIC